MVKATFFFQFFLSFPDRFRHLFLSFVLQAAGATGAGATAAGATETGGMEAGATEAGAIRRSKPEGNKLLNHSPASNSPLISYTLLFSQCCLVQH